MRRRWRRRSFLAAPDLCLIRSWLKVRRGNDGLPQDRGRDFARQGEDGKRPADGDADAAGWSEEAARPRRDGFRLLEYGAFLNGEIGFLKQHDSRRDRNIRVVVGRINEDRLRMDTAVGQDKHGIKTAGGNDRRTTDNYGSARWDFDMSLNDLGHDRIGVLSGTRQQQDTAKEKRDQPGCLSERSHAKIIGWRTKICLDQRGIKDTAKDLGIFRS